jgi:hypothetical protein
VTIIQERWEFFGNIPVGGRFRVRRSDRGYCIKIQDEEDPVSGATLNAHLHESPYKFHVNDQEAVLFLKEVSQ